MTESPTNIIIDNATKKEAMALLDEFGIDLSTAVNILLKQMVYEGSLPISIMSEVPNSETKKAIENVRNGVGLSKGFHSVSELMEDLYADD